jgi:hypothetical protein
MSRVTKYRHDVNTTTGRAEYLRETWEDCDVTVGSSKLYGQRIVDMHEKYSGPLEDWEYRAYQAGWTEPDHFTYCDTLPDNATPL